MRRYSIAKRLLSLLLVLVLCLPSALYALAADNTAVAGTVQLAKTEGTVSVTNANGRKATILKNMKLYNGYHVSTEAKSYSWINLDSTKLIKEDASSQVEIRESGKKLEVLLNSGNLYFNVTKDLEEEETLNIRTSTMVAGIRGTCGWVHIIDRWNTHVYILEGRVECRVADPVTGQIKSTVLTGGEQANFVVYPQDRAGDKCDILQEHFTESDIPGFVLVELVRDKDLCKDIYDDSGLDVLGKYPSEQEAQRRLEEDEAEAAKRQEEISAQETQQEHNISKDPVWKDTAPGGSSGGSSSSGGTSNPTRPGGATTLTMPVTVPQIIDALARYDTVNIVPGPGAAPADHTLTIDQALTVPAGETLNVAGADTGTSVQPGQTLQVDGTMDIAGGFTNSGTLNVTSGNTFKVGGSFSNEASGVINNTKNGRIVAEKGIASSGKINNTDSAEITSGALYTILAGSFFDYSIDPVFVTAGITGGWITNTNPKGGFALAGHNSGVENLSGCISHLRSVTPNIVGDDEGILGIWKALRFGGYSIALQDGYYRYVEAPGSTTQTTYNSTSGMFYSSLTPVREGYVFRGWNTAADGSGTAYAPGTWPVGDENPPAAVYAQWDAAASYNVTVTGTVRNTENGNPIPNATVTLSRSDGTGTPISQHVGADGSYTITGTLPEGDYQLVAHAPVGDTLTSGSKITTFTVSKAETLTFNLTLALYRYTVTISGKVTDRNGNAVAGAKVSLDGYPDISAVSSDDGSYSLKASSMPAGTYSLKAQIVAINLTASGTNVDMLTFTDTKTVSIMDKTPVTQDLALTVPNNTYIRIFTGTVTDSTGRPAAGVDVVLESSARDDASQANRTNASGVYTTSPVLIKSGDVISLKVIDSPYGSARESFKLPGGMTGNSFGASTQDLQLSPTTFFVTFTGKVFDNDGIPLSGIPVELYSKDNPSLKGSASTNAEGMYLISNLFLEAGQYALRATYSDYSEVTADITVSKSGTVEYYFMRGGSMLDDNITLQIRGQVYSGKDESGKPIYPVPGAEITVTSSRPGTEPSIVGTAASTEPNGNYSCSITVYKDATVTVSVGGIEGYDFPPSQTFKVDGTYESGDVIGADFELSSRAAEMIEVSVSGKVTDGTTGNPIFGATVTATSTSSGNSFSQTTGEDGLFSIKNIHSIVGDTIIVDVKAFGYEPLDPWPATVGQDDSPSTSNLSFVLSPSSDAMRSVTFSGKVTNEHGSGVPDAEVALYSAQTSRAEDDAQGLAVSGVVKTGSDGTYSFTKALPDGTYIVKATAGGRTVSCSEQIVIDETSDGQSLSVPEIKVGIAYELKDGVLTYTGCGATAAYINDSGSPWSKNTEIKSIVIHDRITGIGSYSFYGCTNLEKVEFVGDSRLKVIDVGAFKFCEKLSDITLPESVTTINNSAFDSCVNLAGINVPAGVTVLGEGAFGDCLSLKEVTFAQGSKLTSIGSRAFFGDTALTEIALPAGVQSINEGTFRSCTSLTRVDVAADSAITGIYQYAFEGCTKLIDFTIPDGVTTIGEYAFQNCSGLTSVSIPGGVSSIQQYAFSHCSGLTSVTFAEGLTNIGKYAFSGCSGLTSLEFPESLNIINESAFAFCSNITKIKMPAQMSAIYDYAFADVKVKSLVIPEGIEELYDFIDTFSPRPDRIYIPDTANSFTGTDNNKYLLLVCKNVDVYTPKTWSDWTALVGAAHSLASDWPKLHCETSLEEFLQIAEEAEGGTSAAMASLSRAGLSTGRLAGALAGASIRPVLRAALSAAAAATESFADVSAGSWYSDAVEYCRTAGLMTGSGGDRFHPEGLMTRAMVASVLYRLAGSPPLETEENPFTDVSAGSWYADAVLWARENGVMVGRTGTVFDPAGTVTREQLAAVLWRLAGSPEAGDSSFADSASIAPYAARAAGWAGGAGVISGMPGRRFAPRENATRAQTAQIITGFVRAQGLAASCSAMNIMCAPAGAALMPDGSLLVTDTYNKIIWRVAGGVSTVYAGSDTVEDQCGQPLGGYNDAALEDSYFKRPWAIVPFLNGWAVSDTDNHAVRLISGEITQTVNGQTKEKLTISDLGVSFDAPTGLASDGEGNLYVADTLQNAIRKISPTGEVTTFAKDLNGPMGLFWAEGSLYAAETEANRIVKITAGKVEVLAGSGRNGFADGPAAQAAFSAPQALTVDEDGTVYVADTANSAVRMIRDGQVTTLIHRDVTDLNGFAPVSPAGLLIQGNVLYICDSFSRKLLVFPL